MLADKHATGEWHGQRVAFGKRQPERRDVRPQRIVRLEGLGDERSVEEIVLDMCRAQGLTLATAESCTGGLIGARLTGIAGSSDVFVGGVVAYSNEVKERQLGVPAGLLEEHGAVSAEVGAAMAAGARRDGCMPTTGTCRRVR